MSKIVENRILLALTTVSVLFSIFLYQESLGYYFFQDDFYEILISRVDNLKEFLQLFAFLENRSSYRPIGLQLYFFISQTLFGLQPILYRAIVFTMFFCTYFLISFSIAKMLKDRFVGYLTSSLWITSSIHYLSLSWIAAAWLIIGSFFFFATNFVFLLFIEKKRGIFYVLSIFLFILTLATFEFFIALIPIMGAWLMLFAKYSIKKTLSLLSPYIGLAVIYSITRLSFASLPNIIEYKISVGPETIKNLLWYFLWTLNIPEEFRKQVIGNLILLNPIFVKEFKELIFKSFASFFAILVTVTASGWEKLDVLGKSTVSVLILSVTWFLTSIIPVLIFPNHSFAMYLAIPSVGIYFFISYLFSKELRIYLLVAFLALWFYSSFVTVDFYKKNYWVNESQISARRFMTEMKMQFPTLPKGATVYYPATDKRFQQAILNGDAARVLYNDLTLKIYFQEVDLKKDLQDKKIQEENIFKFNSNGL